MPEACRINDVTMGICDDGHRCCPHYRGGKCTEGSPDVYINGRSAVRAGDKGDSRCPHDGHFSFKGGSSRVYINGRRAIRTGDSAGCEKCDQAGEVTTGSRDVMIG